MQPALAQRHRHLVVGAREMVEPDLHISGFDQRIRYRIGLVEPFEAVGKPRLVDHALMLLEGRNVRVTEHGEAIGAKFDASPDRVEAGSERLMRQSVDQIEADAGDAGATQAVGRGGGLFETLHPVDGALHDGIEALHAEVRPVHAAQRERVDHRCVERARIDLDRDLGGRQNKEGVPDRSDQIREGLRRHDGRRSPTEMDVVDLQPAIDLS